MKWRMFLVLSTLVSGLFQGAPGQSETINPSTRVPAEAQRLAQATLPPDLARELSRELQRGTVPDVPGLSSFFDLPGTKAMELFHARRAHREKQDDVWRGVADYFAAGADDADGVMVSVAPIISQLPDLAPMEAALRLEIDQVLAEAVGDGQVSDAAFSQHVSTLGLALLDQTLLFSPGTGGLPRDALTCPNWIVGDVRISGDSAVPALPAFISYITNVSKVADPVAMEAAADALARISQGIHCIPNAELVAIEAAYVGAITTLMTRLEADGKRAMATALFDSTLPVTVLFYDAIKTIQLPNSYRLLRLPRDFAGTVRDPDLGAVEPPAPAMDYQDTLAYGLYCSGPEGGLTLDGFGIWLPDLRARGNLVAVHSSRDARSSAGCIFLERITDLPRLGEGDCSLLEMMETGYRCFSPASCRTPVDKPKASPPAVTDLPPKHPSGSSASPSGPVTARGLPELVISDAMRGNAGGRADVPIIFDTTTLIPHGSPASPFTRLGTLRSEIDRTGCSGRPPPPAGAVLHQCRESLSRSGRGRFAADPETDRVLRCSQEAVAGARSFGFASVELADDERGMCLAGRESNQNSVQANNNNNNQANNSEKQKGDDSKVGGKDSTSDKQTSGRPERTIREAEQAALQYLRSSLADPSRIDILVRVADRIWPGGVNPDHGRASMILRQSMERSIRRIETGQLHFEFDRLGIWGEYDPYHERGSRIALDLEYHWLQTRASHQFNRQFLTTVSHEVLHEVLDGVEAMGGFFTTRGEARRRPDREAMDHEFLKAIGLRSCAPEDDLCGTGCSYVHAVTQRFVRCVSSTPNPVLDTPDPGPRPNPSSLPSAPVFDPQCFPGLSRTAAVPMCLAVLCDGGDSTVQHACCRGTERAPLPRFQIPPNIGGDVCPPNEDCVPR